MSDPLSSEVGELRNEIQKFKRKVLAFRKSLPPARSKRTPRSRIKNSANPQWEAMRDAIDQFTDFIVKFDGKIETLQYRSQRSYVSSMVTPPRSHMTKPSTSPIEGLDLPAEACEHSPSNEVTMEDSMPSSPRATELDLDLSNSDPDPQDRSLDVTSVSSELPDDESDSDSTTNPASRRAASRDPTICAFPETDVASIPATAPLPTDSALFTSDEAAEGLIPAVEKRFTCEDVPGEGVAISSPFDLASLRSEFQKLNTACKGTQYVVDEGAIGSVRMYNVERDVGIVWPDTPEQVEKPSISEATEFIEQLIREPLTNPISYYGGNAKALSRPPLQPGHVLSNVPNLTMANQEYYHIGPRGSGTAFHCEDSCWRSLNIVDLGVKVWLLIPESHTEKFEAFIRKHWSCNDCSQFVRHQSLLVAPSRLRSEGVNFDIKVAGPGDVVLTRPRQYHVVVNYSYCIARSINFLLPGEPVFSGNISVCALCGLFGFRQCHNLQVVTSPLLGNEASKQTHRKRPPPLGVAANTRAGLAATAQQTPDQPETITGVWRMVKIAEPLCRLPRPDECLRIRAFKLVCAVWSRHAIQTLAEVVELRRNSEQSIPLSQNPELRLEQRLRRIRRSTAASSLYKLQRRIDQVRLFEEREEHLQGGLRLEKNVLGLILEKLGWTYDKYNYHLNEGKQWKALCRSYPGLLSFIPLSGGHASGAKKIKHFQFDLPELNEFHRLLNSNDYTRRICRIGEVVQGMLEEPREIRFVWEDLNVDWSVLSEEELFTYFDLRG